MKCKTHGTELIEVTELNKALCYFQYQIVHSWFCPECQPYPEAIRDKLANPNTDCKTCGRKNPRCFAGWGESLAHDGETEATNFTLNYPGGKTGFTITNEGSANRAWKYLNGINSD